VLVERDPVVAVLVDRVEHRVGGGPDLLAHRAELVDEQHELLERHPAVAVLVGLGDRGPPAEHHRAHPGVAVGVRRPSAQRRPAVRHRREVGLLQEAVAVRVHRVEHACDLALLKLTRHCRSFPFHRGMPRRA
jgi:hypothetical protein